MVKNTIHFNSEGMVKMSSHIYDVNIDLSCLLSLYLFVYAKFTLFCNKEKWR